MTCPSCGTIVNDDAERCVRCGSLVTLPEREPDFAIPVLRAPTNRGVAAQLAAGIVGQALARPTPPRSGPSVTAAGTPIPVPVSADAYAPGPRDAGPTPASGHAGPERAPGSSRPDAGPAPAPARARTATPPPARAGAATLPPPQQAADPAFAIPPPPPALEPHPVPQRHTPSRHTPPRPAPPAHPTPAPHAGTGPQAASPWHAPAGAADPTTPRPSAGSEPTIVASRGGETTGVLPAEPARRREPVADETRPRSGEDGRTRAPWPPPPGPWSGRRTTRES